MKVSGRRISNTDKDLRRGQMVQAIKVTTLRARNMGSENSLGLMGALMKDSFWTIILKGEEYTSGQMAEGMMANGRTTRWKGLEFSRGQMEENTRVSTLTTRRKVQGSFTGLMDGSMKVLGKTESSMAWELIPQQVGKLSRESGRMERGKHGSDKITLHYYLFNVSSLN
jgi:hypothetical protein